MSDLRDARLRRALESAPDEHLLPNPRTRQAVREAARRAVAPVPAAPWWYKLWQGLGERHRPWNAALATVVLATLVTLLWRDLDVTGDRPASARSDQAVPAESPPPATTGPAAGAPAPQAPAVMSRPAPPAAESPAPAAAESRSAAAAPRKPAPVAKPPLAPQPPARQAQAPAERRALEDTDSLRDQQAPGVAKSAPPVATAEAPLQADAAAAARAPVPSAAPAAPALARSAPSGLSSQREAAGSDEWTRLRIVAAGRSFEIARERAPRMAELLEGIRRAGRGQEPWEGPAELRVELIRGREPAGVIELAGSQVRWTPGSGGIGNSLILRPEPAQLDALREEIGRLLQR